MHNVVPKYLKEDIPSKPLDRWPLVYDPVKVT